MIGIMRMLGRAHWNQLMYSFGVKQGKVATDQNGWWDKGRIINNKRRWSSLSSWSLPFRSQSFLFFFYSKKKKVAAQTIVYKEDLLLLVTRNQSCCSAGSAHLTGGNRSVMLCFSARDLWNWNIAQERESTATVTYNCIFLSDCSSPYIKSSNPILSDPSLLPNKFPCWVLQN